MAAVTAVIFLDASGCWKLELHVKDLHADMQGYSISVETNYILSSASTLQSAGISRPSCSVFTTQKDGTNFEQPRLRDGTDPHSQESFI